MSSATSGPMGGPTPAHGRPNVATIKVKMVNGEQQLQALVDGKKIVVTEASVRRDLQLDDEEAQQEQGEGSAMPTDPHHTPTIILPSTSQPLLKQRLRIPKRKDTEVPQPSGPIDNVTDEAVIEEMDDSLEITSLKLRVKKLEKKGGSRTHKLKRLYKVGRYARVVSSDEASLGDQEDASKQGRKIDDIDKDAEITLEKENVVEEPSESIITTPTLTTTTATTVIAASTRPKAKGLVIHEEEQETTLTVSSQQPSQLKKKKKKKKGLLEKKLKENKKPTLFHGIIKKETLYSNESSRNEEQTTTKAQKRNTMSTYLKNMARYKHNQLKNKSFDGSETRVEGSSKRVEEELEQESSKKKKLEKDKETIKLQRLTDVVPDKEEVAIDVIPLATKPPSIGDLKTMFDPHVEDQVWKNQQDYRVLDWKLYNSCGVHSLRKQNVHIHMLVEERYPLTPAIITDMLNRKLQADH
ncbi:hypothetical protein Tco_0150382 [Tanacetum coccineum]